LFESGKSPSNSISKALLTNEKDGKLMIAFSQLNKPAVNNNAETTKCRDSFGYIYFDNMPGFQEMTFTLILRRWTLKQQASYEDMTLPLILSARMMLKIQIILMNHIQMMVRYYFVNNYLAFYKQMVFCKLIDLFLIADSISRKSPNCVDEMRISQSSMTDSNLSGNEIEAINETTNKTAVSNSANQIDKFSAIRK
jgi:hypothetical protein